MRSQQISRTYRVVGAIVRTFLFAVTRRDWRGAEHLATGGGVIVAANHMTLLDPLTTAHFLYDNDRAPRILAKSSLFSVPVLGFVLRHTGQIPVYRGSTSARNSLVDAERALEEGSCVLIFPEGTLTRDPDLWPMAAKTGVARLALATRTPVVPVAQWGVQRILARYGKLPRLVPRKQVHVWAGPPVDLTDLYDQPPTAEVLREATERVMAAITAMLAEIRREQPPAKVHNPWAASEADGGQR